MRVMVIVKATRNSEAGLMPGEELLADMGKFKDPAIKQLPVLIVGFNAHGYVNRVYTLKTH